MRRRALAGSTPGLNAFYVLLALVGLCLRPRLWPSMLAYLLFRSAVLWTVEAPEARYTLEAFPILFVLGGIAIGRAFQKRRETRTSALTR